MKSLKSTAEGIIKGLNYKYGCRLVMNTTKFFNKRGELITITSIQNSWTDEDGNRTNYRLFRSASKVHIVMFLAICNARLGGLPDPEFDNEGFYRSMNRNNGWKGVDYLVGEYKDTDS